MSAIAERAAAGAAFLDEHDPDWWRADVDRAIDLDDLNLQELDTCVLGQRCPLETLTGYIGETVYAEEPEPEPESYWSWARYYAFGLALKAQTGGSGNLFTWASGYGFASDYDGYADLTAEWTRVITERRAAA